VKVSSLPEDIRKKFAMIVGDHVEIQLEGVNYFVRNSSDDFYITNELGSHKLYKKHGQSWVEYVSEGSERSKLFPKNIPNFLKYKKYDIFIENNDPKKFIFFFDKNKKSKMPEYMYDGVQFKKIINAREFSLSESELMRQFESSLLSEIIRNEKGVTFINFPRYNLSFHRNDDGKYLWDKKNSFQLKFIKNTELGSGFRSFLGLQSTSASKEKKILIPCQSYIFAKPGETEEVLFDINGILQAEKHISDINATLEERGNAIFQEPGSQRYIECDIDENGILSTKNTSDKIYLLYLFLAQSNYERAFDIFKEIELSGYYVIDKTVKEHLVKVLCQNIPVKIEGVSDYKYNKAVLKNGKRAAVQLKLLVNTLRTNLCAQSKEFSEFLDMLREQNKLENLLTEYITYYSNIPSKMVLSKEEELMFFSMPKQYLL
jgi:hypothetical protein